MAKVTNTETGQVCAFDEDHQALNFLANVADPDSWHSDVAPPAQPEPEIAADPVEQPAEVAAAPAEAPAAPVKTTAKRTKA